MKPETYTKLGVIAVLVILAALFRWQVLSDGILGNTFTSFLSTFPFFNEIISSYGTLHGYFSKVEPITYTSFLDSTMKTILMILVQPPVNKFFNAVFIPVRTGRSMNPSALSKSEQIDAEEEYINSSRYKVKEIYSNIIASLTVTLFILILTVKLSDAFSEIENGILSGFIETILVILMLVASILALRDSSHLGLMFSISYRTLGIAVKYCLRCVSNVFLLKLALELLSRDFSSEFTTAIAAIAASLVGWMVFVMLENYVPELIRKGLIGLRNHSVLHKQDKQ